MKFYILTIWLLLLFLFFCSPGYGQQKDTLWNGKTPTQLLQKGKSQRKAGAILLSIGAAMIGWVVLDYEHGNPRDEGLTRVVVLTSSLPVTATGITLFTIGSIKKRKANLLLAYDRFNHPCIQPTTALRIGLSIPLR